MPVIDAFDLGKVYTDKSQAEAAAEERYQKELEKRPFLSKYDKEEIVILYEFDLVESEKNQCPNLIEKL